MDKQWDVIGTGSATVDDLLFVDHFPVQDTKQPILRSERHGGGLCATAMVASARLGARTAFAGVLGYDDISRWVEDDLAQEGIDVSLVVHREDARPIHAHIIVDEQGTRTILYEVRGRIGADDTLPDADTIRKARVLFVDDFGLVGQVRMARAAREAGIPVVGDFEIDASSRVDDLVGLVNHLILSAGFATRYTGIADPAEAARSLWRPDRAVVIVTAGTQGSWTYDGEHPPMHQPAFPVRAVDTTGCGDVFHGAYAASLNWNLPLMERVRFAAAAAALKATQPGGRRGIPRREQVEAFLRERGESSL